MVKPFIEYNLRTPSGEEPQINVPMNPPDIHDAAAAQQPEPDEEQGPPDPRPIEVRWPLNIVKAERTVYELHRQWQSKHLRLSPDYQREFVWRSEQQMRLVESVMARIPLPVFYLSEESEDELLVVDGQQRLTTLFAFLEGWFPDPSFPNVIRTREDPGGRTFRLDALRLMPELNGHPFASLDPKLQRRFENAPLTCFILQKGTPAEVKFELFGRLNQGGTPLNPQEMRNALARGPGLELVKELATQGGRFREVAGPTRRFERGRGQELVLRGLSFLWRDYKNSYRGDLQYFLNDALRLLNATSEQERQGLRARYLQALDVIHQVFGAHSFQRYDPDRRDWSVHLSGPLVEIQIAALGRACEERPLSAAQATFLRDRFQRLCEDRAFVDAILSATQTRTSLELRMRRFQEIVNDALQLES